jgi:hypothetical protein
MEKARNVATNTVAVYLRGRIPISFNRTHAPMRIIKGEKRIFTTELRVVFDPQHQGPSQDWMHLRFYENREK